ncbi:MAG TPA: carboxypeptidase-like regulatory domain-containing protein [Candidatus Ozemobacteraceae bacterium]|nr:carboxypeptidase-like regulatory domain-containing protein [Candidatus Ozemobacteraceae bacterium]
MGNSLRATKARWLLPAILVMASIMFTGCEKGSLGVKNGSITGFVLEETKNTPLTDVLVRIQHPSSLQKWETLTGANGQYTFNDMVPNSGNAVYTILAAEKFGYRMATDTFAQNRLTVGLGDGGITVTVPVIQMYKLNNSVKGTLKGYPVDAITGTPLTNFTVTQMTPSRSKTFEAATDFRDSGWQSLEGGEHQYKITCENYKPYITAGNEQTPTEANMRVVIGAAPFDMGVVKLQPETVSINGTLRNLPGYVLDAMSGANPDFLIWAESGGKTVATVTPTLTAGAPVYTLANVPVTVGAVSVKCKLRGYDVITINPSVALPRQRPGTIIAGIDCDFHNVEPIKRDLRIVLRGSQPEEGTEEVPGTPSSIDDNEIIRVYLKQGGKDLVPYVDAVGHNQQAEAYFSGVITGYKLEVMAINTNRGYIMGEDKELTVLENGNTVFTFFLEVQ